MWILTWEIEEGMKELVFSSQARMFEYIDMHDMNDYSVRFVKTAPGFRDKEND